MKTISSILLLALILSNSFKANAQLSGFDGVSIQGQLSNPIGAELNLVFKIIDYSDVVIFEEIHSNVNFSDEGSFTVFLGQGIYLGGTISVFSEVNWLEVKEVQLYRNSGASSYLLVSVDLLPVPYAFHSLYNLTVPVTVELIDLPNTFFTTDYTIKYDGLNFYLAADSLNSPAQFAFDSQLANYVDTVEAAYTNSNTADSAEFSFQAGTSSMSSSAFFSYESDTAQFADTVYSSIYSTGNWLLTGNSGNTSVNFIGSSDLTDFKFSTPQPYGAFFLNR